MELENDHSPLPTFEEVVASEMEITKRWVWTLVFRRSLLPMVLPGREPHAAGSTEQQLSPERAA